MSAWRESAVVLALMGAVLGGAPVLATEASPGGPDTARQGVLVRMVRQDCGSCHGMRLTGGLGPALTREALASRSAAALAVVILHGRPGTPMPPWRGMVSEAEARWIAAQLVQGFPEEAGVKR